MAVSSLHCFTPDLPSSFSPPSQSFSISHDDEPPPPSVLTLSDIGQGENTLCAFFEFCRRSAKCPQVDNAQAHYHACMPGHELDAADLLASTNISIDAMVDAILALVEQRNISRLVAFGIGYGATVLLHAAAKAPRKISALVLFSPLISASTIAERFTQTADSLVSRQLGIGLSRRTRDRLLYRWLSHLMNEDNSAPAVAIEEDLDRRNTNNVIRLLSEDAWRQSAVPVVQKLRARVILITGKESSLRYHVEDNSLEFNSENTSRLDVVRAGSLPYDEMPETVANGLSLFLQGIPGLS